MIEIRPCPWPYRAMLAICSDLDETPGAAEYLEYARYLNTQEMTRAGQGVGLEVGNTLYFDMPPGQFSYWNADEDSRSRIRTLIRSGHIDALHSYGDLATTRRHAATALEELARHGCQLPVWIDHAVAATNFGPDIMSGKGDLREHPAYHADLTLQHGVRHIWIGRVTACMGQDAPWTPWTCIAQRTDVKAAINTARDALKYLRGSIGDAKYQLHAGNSLIRPYTLRDGQMASQFMRCNPNPHGVSVGDNSRGIPDAINEITLDRLVNRGGKAIIYTHLGKGLDPDGLVPRRTRDAFELLADYSGRKEILVTTTRRLLDYRSMLERITFRLAGKDLHVSRAGAVPDGLTLYGLPEGVRCLVDGDEVILRANPADTSGRVSHSFPWPRLNWPL